MTRPAGWAEGRQAQAAQALAVRLGGNEGNVGTFIASLPKRTCAAGSLIKAAPKKNTKPDDGQRGESLRVFSFEEKLFL